jgi:hypothetical protein
MPVPAQPKIYHIVHVDRLRDTITKVYAWNDRKKRFSPRQIGIAFEIIRTKGWLATSVGEESTKYV